MSGLNDKVEIGAVWINVKLLVSDSRGCANVETCLPK